MIPEPLTSNSLANASSLLSQRDKDLASIFVVHGPPPMWARPPGFTTLVRIILEQQVSLASAAAMYRRIRDNTVPFHPGRFVELGEQHFKSLGMTRQKTAHCLHLAESIVTGALRLRAVARMSDEEARGALMQVKGIGYWSADIYLLMALRRPDIWPIGDLALVTAVTKLKRLKSRPTPDQFLKMADAWRPYRAVAARMLWQYYLAQRPRRSAHT